MASTLTLIAEKAGVSTATVSMALRGKGRMSDETRNKIKAAAEELDYRVHPILSQACSLARRASARNYRETLGFILEYPMETCGYYQRALYDAARDRAEAMGYKLEPFIATGKRSQNQSLSRILVARGIRGIIILQRLGQTQPRLYLDWKNFAAVEINRYLRYPRNLHHIDTVDYHKILEAMHLLKKVGFRRIGMAVEPMQNNSRRGIYAAASLIVESKKPVSKGVPPLISFGPWCLDTFQRWLDRYKPDVLYVHHNSDIMPWLDALGLKVPGDISIFCANVHQPHISGLRRDYAGMGRSAVEMVSLLLGDNCLGLPRTPRCWLVDELWQAGTTLSHSIDEFITADGVLSGAKPRTLQRENEVADQLVKG
ncbi:MAG: LacI family DNA-binding transcriptional regulator [Candidatus Methylacidiphilales bacterium]|nr:LacI family DNA-binding transcriptional regulator [Candidatus Methylacidiphilales bacterium]